MKLRGGNMTDKYTYIDDADVWQCNDCGAYADKKENIQHHPTCVPGEAKKWEEFYDAANRED
jgi:rubrerythrin